MKQKPTIAILGGGGRTGRFLVSKLIRQGYSLKLLLRNPDNFDLHDPLIKIVTGDATNPASIHQLLQDCDAVISTVGQRKDEPLVASTATINILRTMNEFKIRRYIVVAGINIDTPFDKKGRNTLDATDWMKANFPIIHQDRQKAYAVLSESSLDWTLVRVPMIEFTEGENNQLKVDLSDCLGNKISAGAITDFLIQQLSDDRFCRQAPFIANG